MLTKWYKDIKKILVDNPEDWLAYLCGQKFNLFLPIMRDQKTYPGLTLQLAKFSFTVFRIWRPFKSTRKKNIDYLIFSSALNQINSVESTYQNIVKRNKSVRLITTRHVFQVLPRNTPYTSIYLNTLDICKIFLLVITEAPALYRELKKKNPDSVRLYFTEFLWTYAFLVYFHKLLNNVRPSYIITTNNFNPSNRSLLAVANFLNIPTVYLQHGAVTADSAPLNTNFAFLDGLYSLNIYKQCELNRPVSLIPKNSLKTNIFLSGQKKTIYKTIDSDHKIGVAINALDNADDTIVLIDSLIKYDTNLIVRWHPTQPEKDIQSILNHYSSNSSVSFSDSNNETVDIFLQKISYLIAGNSSIHLEAALAGVVPIYYESTPLENPDWYQFVKNRLSLNATSIDEVISIINNKSLQDIPMAAIQYYSSTYNTPWEGHEGRLVVECLEKILLDESTPIRKQRL